MKKETKQDLIFLSCIAIFLVLYILIITKFGTFFYGGLVDWNTQHYAIPDYFRKLFYQTKTLFPSFALHLGNGQNIYNLSYYGLLNPIILISYMFPFISMRTYIQISSVFLIFLSIILLYKWLKPKYDFKITAISTILFTLASPLLYHTHKHIMFINYLPFVILGLIAVDNYFKNNKKSLLILSVFLIISTSYYFSISGILALTIYGIYVYINKNKNITFKGFIKDGFKFAFPIIIGILVSSIILIPTFIALINGRANGNSELSLITLFIPNENINSFLYHCRTLGVTTIIIFSIIYGVLNYKKSEKFLSITLLLLIVFRIFMYILNGTLYTSGKALIPFLPLYIYLFSNFLKNALKQKYKLLPTIILFIIFFLYEFSCNKDSFLFLYDSILTIMSILLLNNKRTQNFFYILIIIISFSSFITANIGEELVLKENIKKEQEVLELVQYIKEIDDSFYRISNGDEDLTFVNNITNINTYKSTIYSSLSNKYYRDFYYNHLGNSISTKSTGQLTNPQNLMFNIYSGNKYIITKNTRNQLGYKLLKETDELALYLNELALPIGYSNNNLMSLEEYSSLSYPYNLEALINYIVVDKEIKSNYKTDIEKTKLEYTYTQDNISLKTTDKYIEIDSDKNGKIVLKLNKKISNKILFIKFDMLDSNSCDLGDNVITINGIANKLSCKTWKYYNSNTSFEYTINEPEINTLEITFTRGNYKISNIEAYTIDYDKFLSNINSSSSFNIDKSKTQGDIIEGTIEVQEDGYFNLSIPYDKGFNIYIDNKKTNYEKIDVSFIGFPIEKGEHHIKIIYTSPALGISKILSLLGCLVLIYIILKENKILIKNNH